MVGDSYLWVDQMVDLTGGQMDVIFIDPRGVRMLITQPHNVDWLV
jgi:hypothetical protein